ncbi:MAG: aminoacyl--tRNA ligase-related protein, partial [Candidatus Jordarchaeaceae archaeon]
MIDIKLVRENPDYVRKNLGMRKDPGKIKLFNELLEVDKFWRKVQTDINLLRQKRNELTRKISQLKKEGKPFKKLVEEASKIAKEIEDKNQKLEELESKERELLLSIPNLLHESVPYGKDEHDNVEIRRWGKPPKFDFEPKDHLTILNNLGLIDFERGAKVAGHQFYYMKGDLVLLDLAIQKFAIDHLISKGYTVLRPPYMINRKAYEGMIDPSDFLMVTYKVEGEDAYLIATAEHPLGAMYMNEVFEKSELPLRLCGVSPCFRKEVGSHGKYTKGLFRVHQFNKVE